MTETKGPEFYRERAELMRTHAKYAGSDKGRFVYLELAAYWKQLADMSQKNAAISESIQESLAHGQAQPSSVAEDEFHAPRR